MRVRGLKQKYGKDKVLLLESHPMRVRGLKPQLGHWQNNLPESHPMRVRGLKRVYQLRIF